MLSDVNIWLDGLSWPCL